MVRAPSLLVSPVSGSRPASWARPRNPATAAAIPSGSPALAVTGTWYKMSAPTAAPPIRAERSHARTGGLRQASRSTPAALSAGWPGRKPPGFLTKTAASTNAPRTVPAWIRIASRHPADATSQAVSGR